MTSILKDPDQHSNGKLVQGDEAGASSEDLPKSPVKNGGHKNGTVASFEVKREMKPQTPQTVNLGIDDVANSPKKKAKGCCSLM